MREFRYECALLAEELKRGSGMVVERRPRFDVSSVNSNATSSVLLTTTAVLAVASVEGNSFRPVDPRGGGGGGGGPLSRTL